MPISKDTLWKGVIESLTEDFLRYFFPGYADLIDFDKGFEFLDTELEKLLPVNDSKKRHADKLIKVWLKNGQEIWFLVHVEVQGYPDPFFALRMFECVYRIRDKFQRLVTGLAIYTDWDQTHHYTEYEESFLGSSIKYQFNTYVLRDHLPVELAKDANPFAAVMEAAWQQLKKPKDEQTLYRLKLDMIRRLLNRNLSKEHIRVIITFIDFYVDFENKEIRSKFEQDLIIITKATQPMGLEEAIREELKQQAREEGREQGIEQGIEKGIEKGIEQGIEIGFQLKEAQQMEYLLNRVAPELISAGFSIEHIATLLNIPLDRVQEIIKNHQN
jgi:predicted transposase YdaD